ncbi:MAG: adaptor protein MecA [Clostridia bacterium]|nr:adaptor protein MecA [Clostridia bacterium]
MELIQIGENALKVMLTKEDMKSYDIVFDMLDYKDIKTRKAINKILAEAKERVGFFTDSENLYIQAFSDGCGGCELFFSRSENKSRLYRFDSLSLLLFACARLFNCGFVGKSEAYRRLDCEIYYLLLSEYSDDFIFLSEIGREIAYKNGFLEEHTEKLCDGAVETLGRLK